MKIRVWPQLLIPALLIAATSASLAQNATLVIEADHPTAKVSPMHYGLMTEEINYAYDGGLYAELVRNRAFMDNAQTPTHWSVVQGPAAAATIALDSMQPLNSEIPTSLRLDVNSASPDAPAGIANSGYWGIPVKPQTTYHASFYAKGAPLFTGAVTISIQSTDGATVYVRETVNRLTTQWRQYNVTLTTGDVPTTSDARLALTLNRPGTVWFSLVSLFPPTWHNQPNGFRPDLMQMLVDLKPGFLRFPGGNYLEGNTIATRFDWKKTLGRLADRPGHQGPWGYRSTDGMGLLEFLRWCEDMNAEPLLAVYAGYSLRGEYAKPGPDLAPYVQDALDEIEYVTGNVTTKWGAMRAKDGHPKPFKLHYVEIGNEDFFDRSGTYDARFAQIDDAIKVHFPGLKTISTVGFEQPASKRVHSQQPDHVDEHYYRSSDEFLRMAPNHYEPYDRKSSAIFVGEWAAYEDIEPWNARSRALPPTPSMKAALGDAAWMTAMERNADLVTMQCYAPLFVNVNPGGRQWRPDMIGYDALRSYGSPSYYGFRMFSNNHGDTVLKTTLTGAPMYCSVTRDSHSGTIYVKYVNPQSTPLTTTIELKGVHSVASTASALVLSADPKETNSIDDETHVVPITEKVTSVKSEFNYTFRPYSITVLEMTAR